MTTLLDVDATTLLPGRSALLDVLGLRRPTPPAAPTTGLVLIGLPAPAGLPLGAGQLVEAAAGLSGALLPGEWLARHGADAFAVVTEEPMTATAGRLLAALPPGAAAGVCPVTADRTAVDVLRLAALGLVLARLGEPGAVVRYPTA
ncbi:hypothetical protein [Klenkia brasiliensis]|uniref:GGDEF domain-containing protein, diguanylate cyclase (C-di-GMP synthetase) or its enzymatically inactive variants n=1 Tax=Klenkia brasiliensis TaxID=333142 RepID=A0A1G7PWC6_9ACTN|nr:hypothetical protein [Klenkia brasiliensis]SDF90564.1 GGDEF domain-containing protein, diguanylate cyclase (c-di-GMP synthetase) or its enzymatically inactive variants [Klenkia brasiliensis]